MKHVVAGLGSLAVLVVAAASLAQTDGWKEYVYTGDGFAIAAHVYTSAAGSNAALMLFVFERHNNDRRSVQQIHANAQDDALGPVKGKLRARTELSLGKYRGAELEFEAQHPDLDTKTHQVRSRYYVVGRKIYHLLAIAPVGEPFPTDADRWFKSFRLTTAADH